MKNADDVNTWNPLSVRPVTAAGVVLVQEVDHEDQPVRLVDDSEVVASCFLPIPVDCSGSVTSMSYFNYQLVAVTLHVVTSLHDRGQYTTRWVEGNTTLAVLHPIHTEMKSAFVLSIEGVC